MKVIISEVQVCHHDKMLVRLPLEKLIDAATKGVLQSHVFAKKDGSSVQGGRTSISVTSCRKDLPALKEARESVHALVMKSVYKTLFDAAISKALNEWIEAHRSLATEFKTAVSPYAPKSHTLLQGPQKTSASLDKPPGFDGVSANCNAMNALLWSWRAVCRYFISAPAKTSFTIIGKMSVLAALSGSVALFVCMADSGPVIKHAQCVFHC